MENGDIEVVSSLKCFPFSSHSAGATCCLWGPCGISHVLLGILVRDTGMGAPLETAAMETEDTQAMAAA